MPHPDMLMPFGDAEVWLCYAAMFLMLMDIITGFSQAVANKAIDSTKMRVGLWHKMASVMLLVLAAAVDIFTVNGVNLGFHLPIFSAVCVYVCGMELASNLENIKAIYPALAQSPIFKAFNKDDDEAQ